MNSDSLTHNPYIYQSDNVSVFSKFIQDQDEVIKKDSLTFFVGDHLIKGSLKKQRTFKSDGAYCKSMFFQIDSKNIVPQSEIRNNQNSDWIFLSFVLNFILLAIFTYKNKKRILQIFKAFALLHFTNQVIREGDISREFFIYPLLIVYFSSLTFFVSNILHYFYNIEIGLHQGLLIFFTLMTFFVIKVLIVKVIGLVFQTKNETFEYLINNIIFSVVLSVFFFFLVFLIEYSSPSVSKIFLYAVIVIYTLTYIFKLIRAFLIGLNSETYNLNYLFLYLCTIEILPISISIKLLINYYLSGEFLT